MVYYKHRYYRNVSQPVLQECSEQYSSELRSDPAILQQFSELLSNATTTEWERNFLLSLVAYYLKNNYVTNGQYHTFQKIRFSKSQENIDLLKEFNDSFTQEMLDDMQIVANIYKRNNEKNHEFFYETLIEKILTNPDFRPTQKAYKNFMQNKYSIGYLINVKSVPKYNVSDFVKPAATFLKRTPGTAFTMMAVIVAIDHELPVTSATGGKRYLIVPFGSTNAITVEERDLKNGRVK